MTLKTRVGALVEMLITKLNALKTNIDTRAVKTITITAGTGLSGGGNLSANRTINVTYGTTAGTSVEGNDPRLAGGTSGPHTHTSPEIISYLGYTPQDESRRNDNIFLDHLNTTKYPSNKGIYHFATPIANFTASGTTHTGVLCSEGVPQHGRDVILNNVGSSVIIACTTETRARYTKKNAGTVTFVAGPGRTLVTVNGTATVNGPAGQQVELISNGTVDTLYHIDNIPSALKADKTITMSAGTGLTGGGTLASNRTFSVNFGTTVNQVARGNHTHHVSEIGGAPITFFESLADVPNLSGESIIFNKTIPGSTLSGENDRMENEFYFVSNTSTSSMKVNYKIYLGATLVATFMQVGYSSIGDSCNLSVSLHRRGSGIKLMATMKAYGCITAYFESSAINLDNSVDLKITALAEPNGANKLILKMARMVLHKY